MWVLFLRIQLLAEKVFKRESKEMLCAKSEGS